LSKPSNKRTVGAYHDLFTHVRAFASTPKGYHEVEADLARHRANNASKATNEYDLISVLEDALIYGEMILKQQAKAERATKEIISARTEPNVEDAISIIKTAIALGYPVPTFVGSKYFSVFIETISYDGDPNVIESLGDYPTEELAKNALVSWIKENFSRGIHSRGRHILGDDGDIHWSTRGETQWVAGERATNEETIHNYFSENSSQGFLIKEREILGDLIPEIIYGQRREAGRPEESSFTYLK
jgi:hypothetical protein